MGPYGIACRGPVSSVLLFARAPFAELFAPGAGPRTVDLTTESQTSVALTKILLADRFGARDVTYARRAVETGAAPAGDAWLLIGDAALRARRAAAADPDAARARPGRRVAGWTGLPFVYAVWAVRSSLPAEEKARLAAFLEMSLAEGEQDLGGIAAAAAAADPSLGDAPELTRYLRAFRYRLGPDEEAGLTCFRALWKEHRLDA